jgi:hypothetical protein
VDRWDYAVLLSRKKSKVRRVVARGIKKRNQLTRRGARGSRRWRRNCRVRYWNQESFWLNLSVANRTPGGVEMEVHYKGKKLKGGGI